MDAIPREVALQLCVEIRQENRGCNLINRLYVQRSTFKEGQAN